MVTTVSSKIEDDLVEFLDDLVINGYADSRSSAVRFCIGHVHDRMDKIEEEKNRRIIKQKICDSEDMKD